MSRRTASYSTFNEHALCAVSRYHVRRADDHQAPSLGRTSEPVWVWRHGLKLRSRTARPPHSQFASGVLLQRRPRWYLFTSHQGKSPLLISSPSPIRKQLTPALLSPLGPRGVRSDSAPDSTLSHALAPGSTCYFVLDIKTKSTCDDGVSQGSSC